MSVGQVCTPGSFYYGLHNGQSFEKLTKIKTPLDFSIPDVDPRYLKVAKTGREKSGIVFIGKILLVEQRQTISTRFGRSVKMREYVVGVRDADGQYHEVPVAVWGALSNVVCNINDWVLFLNAKQSMFLENARFSVGEAGAVVVIPRHKHTPQIVDLEHFVSERANGVGGVELPDGFEAWDGNDEDEKEPEVICVDSD
jgi:hypothetical protein